MGESNALPTVAKDDATLKVFRCLNCACVLGHTDGTRLQIANALFYVRTRMFCVNCGSMRQWHPVNPLYKATAPPLEKLAQGVV